MGGASLTSSTKLGNTSMTHTPKKPETSLGTPMITTKIGNNSQVDMLKISVEITLTGWGCGLMK